MAQRYDIGTLQPCQRRPDGTIVCDALLTRCGIFEYSDPDAPGGVRRELRLPEEVGDPASLATLVGRPFTNDHPAGMLDSTCATEHAVGGLATPASYADEHVRAQISVWDGKTVGDMERGKRDISLGYTCDTEDTPGTHPIWGAYHSIQRAIRYNHASLVDQGRAGTARARMDGMMVRPNDGTALASHDAVRHTAGAMPATARIDVVVRTDKGEPSATAQVDPDDLAHRNAEGQTSAKPTDDDADPDDGGEDAYDASYDEDGELTAEARNKIKASNFAVPDKEKLPIHDKPHVRAAMSRFGQTDFEGPDEKHGAFNRIKSKAKQFGISTTGFEKAHAGKLDRADGPQKDTMKSADDIKAAQAAKDAKKAERKAKLDAAEKTAESEKAARAKAEGERDAAIARADAADKALAESKKAHADAADAAVNAKVALLEQARATGAKVDASMAPRAIKVATIKHVTKADIADDKHDAYVDARYEGAVESAKTDAAATAAGASAIAGARAAAVGDPNKAAHTDADDTDEVAAATRMRTSTATSWHQPGRKSKGN